MADLPTTRPALATRAAQRTHLAMGALLGALVWLECIAIGLPRIAFGRPGYNLIPLAVIAGGALAVARFGRALLWAALLGLAAVIAIVAYTPIIRAPARALIRSDRVEHRLPAAAALSSDVSTDGHLRDQGADRLLSALALVRRGVTETLMLSRVRVRAGGRDVTPDADQRRLIALVEQPVRMLVVDSVYSTRDEAVRMRAAARPLGIDRIAVVTSPLHTSRACATFEKVGFQVTCVPSESRDVAVDNVRHTSDRVRLFSLWFYERVAWVVYRARGWV